jgi:hypothetical protein
MPTIKSTGGAAFTGFLGRSDWCCRISAQLNLAGGWKIDFESFLRDNAGAIEIVLEPEIGGERVMRCRGDNAVFEDVAGG